MKRAREREREEKGKREDERYNKKINIIVCLKDVKTS